MRSAAHVGLSLMYEFYDWLQFMFIPHGCRGRQIALLTAIIGLNCSQLVARCAVDASPSSVIAGVLPPRDDPR